MRSILTITAVAILVLASCATERGHMRMHDGLDEYEFLVEMIPHHQEAVDTGAATAARTERAQLRAFAEGIVRAQSAEIDSMRQWLSAWYPGKSTRADYRPMMRPVDGMTPDRADRAFLEDMVMHHRMAVMMADRTLRGGAPLREETRQLLESIIRTQNQEIKTMEAWLREWYGVSGGSRMMH